MIEGTGKTKTWAKAKAWFYKWPDAARELLRLLTDVNIGYLVNQIRAGAQLLEVMDTNAGYLGPKLFREFVVPELARTAREVKARCRAEGLPVIPMTCFAKGC